MKMHNSVFEVLQRASSFLSANGREETAARLLMQHVLQINYSDLMLQMQEQMSNEQIATLEDMLQRHAEGVPVQYITGVEEFYGRPFQVDESVLIPRPETEELIVGAITRIEKLFGKDAAIQLADIGTGSGAIAITMKLECPNVAVTATDISQDALATAEQNAMQLQAAIDFRLGDLTEPIAQQKWDVILSNPPYIAYHEAKEMSDIVLEHEPHTALFADEDGLFLYRKLAEQLPALMRQPALIGVEIGYMQGRAVAAFFQQHFPQATIEIVKDINRKDRIVFCVIDE
ncbi:peptide chain release factor N(5)-glutamine methyltransferase [Metasolibacillus fluoroglycofenilyticus]|uniref:peptide chain release factor N(5)-glutamine methyltransferase n=1 Tax=Metasolibacillus fluoroglycofenilyticus TaxID=1239396 RepID=UPI000D38EDC0|nr:peptide chain release factor N(5)-glutamine methyltransferase [Metasolibacillus fluoroglycofenilyticus]